jgi:hypothetical protein
LTVQLDGVTLAESTGYTYAITEGEFATVPGVITAPAATYTQDPTTGVWSVGYPRCHHPHRHRHNLIQKIDHVPQKRGRTTLLHCPALCFLYVIFLWIRVPFCLLDSGNNAFW